MPRPLIPYIRDLLEDDAARYMLFKKAAVILLALVCVSLGIKLLKFQSGGLGLGVVASFLLFTGAQIFLWLFGIRIELFGTSAVESLPTYRGRPHRYVDPEFEQMKENLEREKEALERELEVAELASKIAELRSKVRQEEKRREELTPLDDFEH